MEKLTTLYQNYSSNVWGGRKSGDYKKKTHIYGLCFRRNAVAHKYIYICSTWGG